MISKLLNLGRFTYDTTRLYIQRVSLRGWQSGWFLLNARILNFIIHQRNKNPANRRVECPCCGWTGYDFLALEVVYFWKKSIICPQCESQDRQRLLNLYITRHHPELFTTPATVLHFAPGILEKNLIFRNPGVNYISTDYDYEEVQRRCPRGRGFQGDIQKLPLASQSIDMVFCIHVLEHVRDPRVSLRELARVLRPGGTAYVMVPFEAGLPSSVEWEEPNPDVFYHIWNFSQVDFKERLADFCYEEFVPASFLSAEERSRYRIDDTEVIYRCVKPF